MALPALVGLGAWAGLRKFLWGLLISIVPYLLSEVFLAVGIGFVTYAGVRGVLDKIMAFIATNLNGLPSDVWSILALAGLGQCLTIITSAYVSKAVLWGLTVSGTLVSPRWGKGKK